MNEIVREGIMMGILTVGFNAGELALLAFLVWRIEQTSKKVDKNSKQMQDMKDEGDPKKWLR